MGDFQRILEKRTNKRNVSWSALRGYARMRDPKRATLLNDRPQIRRNRFGRVVVRGEGII